tara:strand:- start:276 stop:488 length:213 start_codon:yes stop_codon:yes gene_type:complete
MNAPKTQYMHIPNINDGVFEQFQSSSAENENKQTDGDDSSDCCDICECCEVCKPCCDVIGFCLSILFCQC